MNVLRIAPYSAVQFSSYELVKTVLAQNGTVEIDTKRRLLAGSLAGVASVGSTYPLDLIRSRLSIEVSFENLSGARGRSLMMIFRLETECSDRSGRITGSRRRQEQ